MKSLWNDHDVKQLKSALDLRVYTSRLLGQDPSLVLHGGGNTSVKSSVENIFGEKEDILFVKGSGWDLGTIEAEGFAPVKMDMLLKMAELESLSDIDMVKYQRSAMIDPSAPNPSVEAILHAIIPFKFVDHTHADAVVTISDTEKGEATLANLFGQSVLLIPYSMPGFDLAKTIYNLTQNVDWNSLKGMILLNHGVFTFHDDAKVAYENMIQIVSTAEKYLSENGADLTIPIQENEIETFQIAQIRKVVSTLKEKPVIAKLNPSDESKYFSKQNIEKISQQGPLTPDHVIRTKRIPAILTDQFEDDLDKYIQQYVDYFEENKTDEICLNPAPNFAVLKNKGTLSFGSNVKEAHIIQDINDHTFRAILKAEALGGFKALNAKEIFDVEYWSLEQAKLKKGGTALEFNGKVALITGSASGIGKAIADLFISKGAAVVALDIDPNISTLFNTPNALGIQCDLTNESDIKAAIKKTVETFGGIDIVVSNAGIFTPSQTIEEMDSEQWEKSLSINLSSHQKLIKTAAPYLKLGIDPAIVMVASKNFPAPGKGAGAYSVAKAGQTQLARIAALELGDHGVRVNTVHPHAVFDTALWTDEILEQRAKNYNMTVQEYKTNNLLKTEIKTTHVAEMVCAMAGTIFSKTTGAQVMIDGGSDRTL
ncbi:MAG: bifunctional aldolase/short-chain dehydrogenase [Candidatus Marinimicrobia bacterium]|nr:bifunctional aldolase/short-chain dehydrogenase [Candidatus Neomarinimicrobiota bacterium]